MAFLAFSASLISPPLPSPTDPDFLNLWQRPPSPLDMNAVRKHVPHLLRQSVWAIEPLNNGYHQLQQLQQCRGIRVKVLNGNLEQALTFLQRKMQSSGIERLIKAEQRHHIKNSEKRVLARKNLERKIQSQELARKLKTILIKKVRGL